MAHFELESAIFEGSDNRLTVQWHVVKDSERQEVLLELQDPIRQTLKIEFGSWDNFWTRAESRWSDKARPKDYMTEERVPQRSTSDKKHMENTEFALFVKIPLCDSHGNNDVGGYWQKKKWSGDVYVLIWKANIPQIANGCMRTDIGAIVEVSPLVSNPRRNGGKVS